MKKFFIFLSLCCIILTSGAQVSPQNGSANFGLPVFSWKDNLSRLNVGIAVNYSSGNGLRVNDIASNIGQGWNLTAGGVITRMQVGEPDDQKPYYQGSSESWQDTKKYPAGYLYNSIPVEDGVSSSINQYPIFQSRNTIYKQHNEVSADKEMDRFTFQFNGRSGVFILDKNTNMGVCLEDNRIKIWFVRNENNASQNQIRTTITGFYIQDENGLIYKFTKYGKTRILKTNYCNKNQTGKLTQPTFKNNKVYYETAMEDPQIVHPYIINEWHLEEIEDALTHRKINFTYVTRNINTPGGFALTLYAGPVIPITQFQKTYTIVSGTKTISQSPELSSMSFPDGHQVILNYGKPRVDLIGGFALNSIDVKYQSRFVSKFEFNTSYFIGNRMGNPTEENQKSLARLCLQSVKKYGPDLKESEQPYLFEYYMGSSAEGDIIPAPFTHLKDIWGFYNGDNSKAYDNSAIPLSKSILELSNIQLRGLCFLREGQSEIILNPKLGYAKNGLLKQIQYPTGGAIKYEYEQNEAVYSGQTTNSYVGGVHVSKTSVTDGGYSNDCDNPLVTNYKFVADEGSLLSSLWGIEMPDNSLTSSSYYKPESKYFYWKPIANMGCKYKYVYPGILAREQAVDLTSKQKALLAIANIMDVVTAVTQVYDILNIMASTAPDVVVAIVLDIISSIINIVFTCFSDPSQSNTMTMYYNSDVSSFNPLPALYKRVEIIEGNGSNGKTVMEFTSDEDYAIWSPENPSFSMKQRFATWAYGLNKRTTIFDGNGIPLKQTENEYEFIKPLYCFDEEMVSCKPDYVNCKAYIVHNTSKRSDNWVNPANYKYPETYINQSNSSVIIDIYKIYTGIALLKSTTEKIYNQESPTDYLQTITEYGYQRLGINYGDAYILNRISHYTPDDIALHKIYSYQYYLSGYLMLPSGTKTYKGTGSYVTNGPGNAISETSTQYYTHPNGDIKPNQVSERRYSVPGQIPEPALKITQSFSYDDQGNLIGQKDEGNRNITNLYDYGNRFIVATLVNVDAENDSYAYSSFETDKTGGWDLSGGTASYHNDAVTGERSFALTSGKTLSTNVNASKPMRLSFWASSNLTVSNGATLVKNEPSINGFTFYEYTIAQGASIVSISGTGNIDELRLLPQAGRIRTITYDPVIGKTSEADENNRVTYYEYDDLGRLRFIKDHYKNTLKMYEYNEAKNIACPVNYTNLKVSEIYKKNDCASGFVGSEVVYTIQAGTYNSTVSQAAVDAMVDNDLFNNGQNYANTQGTCIPQFSNVALSENFTKEGCPVGFVGTTITYTVPAGTYFSTISQADADEQAQEELDANGQAYANFSGNADCVISYDAVWEGTDNELCIDGHKWNEVKDMNPNSATYNQTQWVDAGLDISCDTSACGSFKITVPASVTNNLYVEYKECNTNTIVSKSWENQIIIEDETPEGDQVTHICSKTKPKFKYGANGTIVDIPSIIVGMEGACP